MDPSLTVSETYLYGTIAQLYANKTVFKAVLGKGATMLRVSVDSKPPRVETYCAFWFESKSREYLIPVHIMTRFALKHPQQSADTQTP